MSYFIVDVEADGPFPGVYSMVSFGAVKVDNELNHTFYSEVIRPIATQYDEEALSISGVTRDQQLDSLIYPNEVMSEFDWQFINGYFIMYNDGYNPFGWSSRRLSDMFAGFYQNARYSWKKHRKTKHTHHPVDDAMGNAEALLYLKSQGFQIELT